jgi:Late embryogenesis abundant protein.
MKKRVLFIALICGLIFTTCDLLKDTLKNTVKEPEVTLKSVDFSEVTFEGLTLLNTVEVKNNNSIDIPLPKIDWDLFVIESPFVNGVIQSDGPLQSNGSTEVQFPVSFEYLNLLNTITALNDDNAWYKIKMTARIPVPELGVLSWPFEHEGKIPLIRAPDITVASAPRASITYGNILGIPNGGRIEFALNVKNNSNVAVTVNDLSCVLKIGNYSLPKGGVDGKPRINAGATDEIPFVFSLTVADIASIGLTALTGGSFSYNLTGAYKFGIPEFPLLNEVGDTFTLQ